ncbi:WD40 repeat-like protein [Hymenopellis radicata]|nr:WD40 repeat-like protein [Hymenopellis radicata]
MPYQSFLRFDGHCSPILMLSFDSKARRLVSAAVDGFKVWDLKTGSVVPHCYNPHGSEITAALWLERTDQPDLLFTASKDAVLLMWDLSQGVFTPITSSPARGHTSVTSVDVKVVNEEHWLICTCEANGTVTLWDADTTGHIVVRWRATHDEDLPGKVAFVGRDRIAMFRTSSKIILEFEEDDYLEIFDEFCLNESLVNITLHGPTRRFVSDSPEAHDLHIGRFTVPERMRTLSSHHPRCHGSVRNLGFVEGAHEIVIGTNNGFVQIYDFANGKLLEEIRVGEDDSFVHSMASITYGGDAFLAVGTANFNRQNHITIYKFRELTVPESIPLYMFAVFGVSQGLYMVYNEWQSGRLHF